MRAVTLAQLRAHAARLVASTLAIVIAVGFVVATLVLNETARGTVLEAVGARYVDTAAVVTSDAGGVLTDDVAPLTALARWRRSTPPGRPASRPSARPDRPAVPAACESVADDPALRWQHLAAGALPTGPGEIAVSDARPAPRSATSSRVGATTADGAATTADATVTGDRRPARRPEAGLTAAPSSPPSRPGLGRGRPDRAAHRRGPRAPTRRRWPPTSPRRWPGGASPCAPGPSRPRRPPPRSRATPTALTAVLLVFATVAVLVAGLVIANTFAVLLAQRTRELALLRCVGATARQVRRSVLGEALLTGLAASALGVLAGIGLAAGVSALVGAGLADPAVRGLRAAVRGGRRPGRRHGHHRCSPRSPRPGPPPGSRRWPRCGRWTPHRCAPAAGVLRLVSGLLLAGPASRLMAGSVGDGSSPAGLAARRRAQLPGRRAARPAGGAAGGRGGRPAGSAGSAASPPGSPRATPPATRGGRRRPPPRC